MSDVKNYERCSGDYPIVWEFTYKQDHHIRVDDGAGDTEYSHTEKDVVTFAHIVAPTDELALAAWEHKYGRYGNLYRYVDHKKLFVIDATITL